jgi:hypothetical protein
LCWLGSDFWAALAASPVHAQPLAMLGALKDMSKRVSKGVAARGARAAASARGRGLEKRRIAITFLFLRLFSIQDHRCKALNEARRALPLDRRASFRPSRVAKTSKTALPRTQSTVKRARNRLPSQRKTARGCRNNARYRYHPCGYRAHYHICHILPPYGRSTPPPPRRAAADSRAYALGHPSTP